MTDVCTRHGCTKPQARNLARTCGMHAERLRRWGNYDARPVDLTVPGVEVRQVPGWGGRYYAGSDGHIYTSSFRAQDRRLRRMSPHPNPGSGYYAVHLSHDGRSRLVFVHYLVTAAWHGPRPDGLVRRHLNGNKADNRPSNLRYGTPAENGADMVAHGRSQRGQRQHCARVPDLDVARALAEIARGTSQAAVARRLGVSDRTVSEWVRGISRPTAADGRPIRDLLNEAS